MENTNMSEVKVREELREPPAFKGGCTQSPLFYMNSKKIKLFFCEVRVQLGRKYWLGSCVLWSQLTVLKLTKPIIFSSLLNYPFYGNIALFSITQCYFVAQYYFLFCSYSLVSTLRLFNTYVGI